MRIRYNILYELKLNLNTQIKTKERKNEKNGTKEKVLENRVVHPH